MYKYLLLLLCVYISSCSTGKYLQQCQVDGVETLGKGMSTVGYKLPEAYARVNKYKFENSLMSKLRVIGKDSIYDGVAEQIKMLSDELARKEATAQQTLNEQSAGWMLCLKVSELLKALADPEFAKVFDDNKEGFGVGVDSLLSKYNFTARTPVNAAFGSLFSEIAFQIGKHKFKKTQKKYFKAAISAAGPVMDTMLHTLKAVQLKNYNQEISSLENAYYDSYIALNKVQAEDEKMTPELAQKMLTELESVRKEMLYLKALGAQLEESGEKLRTLIQTLMNSVNGDPDCNKINSLITDIETTINRLDTYASFLK